MPEQRETRLLDVVTAVMLGVVSVVTALGAWQASAWDARSEEFARDAGDARDVSVTQSVQANYAARVDLEASVTARFLAEGRSDDLDAIDGLLLDTQIQAALVGTTPGFSDVWLAWQAAGFNPAADPVDDPDYQVARDGFYQSYAAAGSFLDSFAQQLQARSDVLAQAALIQALALFLIGLAGVNRVLSVRISILGFGILVFLLGLFVALSAPGAGA